jgi:transposase
MARPSECTSELRDRVAQLVRAGNYPERAAVAAGVSARTYYRWMERGSQAQYLSEEGRTVRASERPYWQFWQALTRAEAESEALAVGTLMKAMPHATTAVVAWLERRFGERWSRSERRELTGASQGPIAVDVAGDATERIIRDANRVASRLLGLPAGAGPAELEAAKNERWSSMRASLAAREGDSDPSQGAVGATC